MNRWEYLLTPAYRLRHAIAAHLVADCQTVVDVGAYRLPLPVSQVLYSIDPLATIPDAHHCTVSEFWAHHGDLAGFGLVMLGLDMTGGASEMHALRAMMDAASVTVLEWATSYGPSAGQAAWLMAERTLDVDMTLRLPEVCCDGYPARRERRLVCWTR